MICVFGTEDKRAIPKKASNATSNATSPHAMIKTPAMIKRVLDGNLALLLS